MEENFFRKFKKHEKKDIKMFHQYKMECENRKYKNLWKEFEFLRIRKKN